MKKILVADDDKNIAKALMIRIKAAGYELAVAHDGLTAFSTAVKEKPDLIILDISMPAGNGFSVAEKLRNNPETIGIPIIFITASKKPELWEAAARTGAAAFVEKPYDPEEFLTTIGTVLERDLHV